MHYLIPDKEPPEKSCKKKEIHPESDVYLWNNLDDEGCFLEDKVKQKGWNVAIFDRRACWDHQKS